jgi:hypothetical protein
MEPDNTWDDVRSIWHAARELDELDRPLTSQEVEMLQEAVAKIAPLVEERKAA